MLPLIQWIERVPEKGRLLIATRKENLRPFAEYLADRLDDLNELVYVGSGSSYNSVMSVKGWIERITKLKVSVMTPNEYLYDRTVRNPNALTIFAHGRLCFRNGGPAVDRDGNRSASSYDHRGGRTETDCADRSRADKLAAD